MKKQTVARVEGTLDPVLGIVLSLDAARRIEEALGEIQRGHECECTETCAVCQALADIADIHLPNTTARPAGGLQ